MFVLFISFLAPIEMDLAKVKIPFPLDFFDFQGSCDIIINLHSCLIFLKYCDLSTKCQGQFYLSHCDSLEVYGSVQELTGTYFP